MRKKWMLLFISFMLVLPGHLSWAKDGGLPVDPYGYPIEKIPHGLVRQLLYQRNYKRLEAVLNEYRKKYEHDFRYEKQLNGVFESFEVEEHQVRHHLDLWVKDCPMSTNAHLARAYYYTGVGWSIYNDKSNSDYINAKQFPLIKPYVTLVEKDVNFVLKKQQDSLPAYLALANINLAAGNIPSAHSIMKKALARYPYSLLLRIRYMNSIRPLYGGSYQIMDRFANDSQRYRRYNSALTLLLGYSWSERARRAINSHFYDNAIQFSNKALSYGEYYLFYHRRACCYQELGKYDLALADVNRSLELSPESLNGYLLRAYLYSKMNRNDLCQKDLQMAEEISPKNSRIQATRRMIQKTKRNN